MPAGTGTFSVAGDLTVNRVIDGDALVKEGTGLMTVSQDQHLRRAAPP